MNVADLELCKELYGLSGWSDTEFVYARGGALAHNTLPGIDFSNSPPAYDLGYLLRKLEERPAVRLRQMAGRQWWIYCEWGEVQPDKTIKKIQVDATADTPENAACKLAIELFKQNILERKVEE